MAPQFQPPPDWLIQSYLARKQPAEIANEGVGNAIGAYEQEKTLQQQQTEKALEGYTKLLDSVGPDQAASIASRVGLFRGTKLSPSNFNPPTVSSGTMNSQPSPGSFQTPLVSTPMEDAMQQSLPSEHPLANSPSVATHIQQSGMNPMGYSMPSQKQFDLWASQGKYGKRMQDQALSSAKFGEALQTASDRNNPVPVMTKEAAVKAGKVAPNTKIVEPPNTNGPDRFATLSDKQLADAQSAYNKDQNITKSQAVVEKVSQAVPLLKAGAIDNATAKQALQTAMTYMATGGMRVNEIELKQFGGADTVNNKMGQWYKSLDSGTLTERDAKDMGKVLGIFLKSAQNNLKEGGLRHTRQYLSRSRSGESESDAYKRVTGLDFPQNIVDGENVPTISNDSDFNALPSGSKFQDPSGQVHTKK